MERLFPVTFYLDHKSPIPVQETHSWSSFIEDIFSEHERTPCNPCPGGKKCKLKFGLAFSPVALKPKTTRADENVESVSMLVLDMDHLTEEELQGVSDRLEGLEAVMASTHSHKPPNDCCVRIVLPLGRQIKPSEFYSVRRELCRRYQLQWYRPGAVDPSGVDPSSMDLSRLYFIPTAPEGVEVILAREKGALLDLEDLLKNATPAPPKPLSRLLGAASPVPVEVTVDMEALNQCMREYKPRNLERDEDEVISRKELVRRVLNNEPLVKPEERGQRERSCHRVGKILANLLPDTTPKTAMLERIRPSIMSLPVYEDDGDDDTIEARFAKVEYSWDRGLVARAAFTAEKAAEKAAADANFERMKKQFNFKSAKRAAGPGDPVPEGDEEEISSDGWEGNLLRLPTDDDSKGPLRSNSDYNLNVILSCAPEWVDVLKFNEVTKEVVIDGGPLLTYEKTPAQITTGVKYWAQSEYGLFLHSGDVKNAILHNAKANAFDPLKDYLNGAKGDDVNRIDTFLEVYCGVKTVDDAGADITEHVRKISRRWLISAVARGLDPGCKVDTVLIFEGVQGLKKSSTLKALGGEWFSDGKVNFNDKDSKMLVVKNWIVEMAELASMRSSEVEQQKAFLSQCDDEFRPAFGHAVEKFPRRCVYVGSTNDKRYLNDPTGNRRFWPVRSTGMFQIQATRRDRDKIWAEAVAVYKAGFTCAKCEKKEDGEDRCMEHRWWFDFEENKALEVINSERLNDEYSDIIRKYILEKEPSLRPTSFSMPDIVIGILGLPADKIRSQQGPIGRSLKVLGFGEPVRRRIHGSLTSQHIVPEELLKAPKSIPGREHLTVVPDPVSDPNGTEKE